MINESLVSIVIPTYNRSDMTRSISINSVLNQTYKNWELIIVDDGSTDETRAMCLNLQRNDCRIKYLYQTNKGQGAARNFGIINSKGEYIILLDSDDYLLPGMVKKSIEYISKGDYDYALCRKWLFNYNKKIFAANYPNPSCLIFKKYFFKKFGYFNEDYELKGKEDDDLVMRWRIYEKK